MVFSAARPAHGLMVTAQDVESVALLNLHHPAHKAIPLAQTKHRFEILSRWNIPPGSRVLEIGCGQGDCTAVLAHIVGSRGHVTAVDPGPINTYGNPHTLAASQSHLSSGVLGPRITWVEANPVSFLKSHPEEKYDFVVLVHCIWYFASPTTLEATFRALRSHATHVIIAEWALSASSPNATPHVLAAFAQASLHNQQPSSGNIRTLLSPEAIKILGMQCGLALHEEHMIVPAPELQDARWEVSEVTSEEFSNRLKTIELEQERCILYALRDAVISSQGSLIVKGERIHGMDVWTGIFHFL